MDSKERAMPPELQEALQDLRGKIDAEVLIVIGFDVGGEVETEEHLDTFVSDMKMLSAQASGVSITAVAVGGILHHVAEGILGDAEVVEVGHGPMVREQ